MGFISSGGYPACVCTADYVQNLISCVNCSIMEASSQEDINTAEDIVNCMPASSAHHSVITNKK
jgi:hypothetical protein